MGNRYIIGIDPSGNWEEGKGITGLAVFDKREDRIVATAYVQAKLYKTQIEYWEANVQVIKMLAKMYKSHILSIEDYLLYISKAKTQINSKMETPQLIGVLKYLFHKDFDIYIRPACAVKRRWSDEILLKRNYLYKDRKGYYFLSEDKEKCYVIEHCRDAIRHAIHCAKFEIDKEKRKL